MTWLIAGGYGQLGKAISHILGQRGIPFVAKGSKDLDIRSLELTLEFVQELNPTVVVNAAAWTNVDGAEDNSPAAQAINVVGASNLAISAKSVGAIFAHISSDFVFSGFRSTPWDERDLCAPISVYGQTKAAGEVAVLSHYPERSFVFRTAWLYSQWGSNFAKTMIRLALSDQDVVRVVHDQIGQPTSALDLANQIVDTIVARLPFGIYHATNSGQASWYDFAQEIFDLCDVTTDRVVAIDSSSLAQRAKRPAYSVLGHGSWKVTGSEGFLVNPMREWRIALRESIPAIISTVKAEK
jgi:dTDP-4-dehydrorhamnose reductase